MGVRSGTPPAFAGRAAIATDKSPMGGNRTAPPRCRQPQHGGHGCSRRPHAPRLLLCPVCAPQRSHTCSEQTSEISRLLLLMRLHSPRRSEMRSVAAAVLAASVAALCGSGPQIASAWSLPLSECRQPGEQGRVVAQSERGNAVAISPPRLSPAAMAPSPSFGLRARVLWWCAVDLVTVDKRLVSWRRSSDCEGRVHVASHSESQTHRLPRVGHRTTTPPDLVRPRLPHERAQFRRLEVHVGGYLPVPISGCGSKGCQSVE